MKNFGFDEWWVVDGEFLWLWLECGKGYKFVNMVELDLRFKFLNY